MDLRAHHVSLLRSGQPIPLAGRLLRDARADGSFVLLDERGAELKDDRPAFVLSTEDEATDRHIVRQHWDLSRAVGAGVPVLWGHDPNRLLGQWQDLQVVDGRLVGRAYFDPEDEEAQHRKGQIKRGILNAVSVGWMPGASIRRGDLDPADPLYREPVDGFCGSEEGMVMGTPEAPNRLIECSLVSTPAQATAIVTERLLSGADRAARQIARGETPRDSDVSRLLAVLAVDPRCVAWLNARVAEQVARALSKVQPAQGAPTLNHLFPGKSNA